MFFEGDLSLFEALAEKKRLLLNGGDHTHIRPMMVGCGGVMTGIVAASAVTTLFECEYGNEFDIVAGNSTSTPCFGYYLSGLLRVGTSIYTEECCSPAFVNVWRWRNVVDTGYLSSVFQGSTGKRLDVDRVLGHRTRFLIGVTHQYSGRHRFVEPRSGAALFDAIHASINIPGWSGAEVFLGGVPYVDGAIGHPLPVKYLVRRYKPTHLLVLANRSPLDSGKMSRSEMFLNETVFRSRISPYVRYFARERRRRLVGAFEWLRTQQETKAVILWSDDSVTRSTRDPDVLSAAAERVAALFKKHLL